jgi:hypothetical protein
MPVGRTLICVDIAQLADGRVERPGAVKDALRDVTVGAHERDYTRFSHHSPFSSTYMNRTDEAQLSSSFGPASEPIIIQDFLDDSLYQSSDEENGLSPNAVKSLDKISIAGWTEWTQTSDERKVAVEEECR